MPTYDRTRLQPGIVHVGVGGFHRAHLAVYVHELASRGSEWGIVGLGLLDADAQMAAALGGQDCLYTLIVKDGGEPSAQVIGSITGFVHAPGHDSAASELIADARHADPVADHHRVGVRRAVAGRPRGPTARRSIASRPRSRSAATGRRAASRC